MPNNVLPMPRTPVNHGHSRPPADNEGFSGSEIASSMEPVDENEAVARDWPLFGL